jgi:hypothetical protein
MTGEQFTNEKGETEFGPLCGPLKATGTAEEGESESLTLDLAFAHCITYRAAGNTSSGLKERVVVKLPSRRQVPLGPRGRDGRT